MDSVGVAHLGWLVGVLSATLANIAFVAVVALSPPLDRQTTPTGTRKRSKMLASIHASLLAVLVLVWLVGGMLAGRAFAGTYVVWLAGGAAATTCAVILLLMYTAANQVGLQAIRR